MIGDPGHGQRMQRLQQQRAQAAYEHRRVGVDAPDRTIFAEPPRARRFVDSSPVDGSVRAGDQTEQAPPQTLPDSAQLACHRHVSTIRQVFGRADFGE